MFGPVSEERVPSAVGFLLQRGVGLDDPWGTLLVVVMILHF